MIKENLIKKINTVSVIYIPLIGTEVWIKTVKSDLVTQVKNSFDNGSETGLTVDDNGYLSIDYS